ncbi:MAG: transposase [Verrucomicrobiae bacterium]|nr:transposase [Verrucomicrobiae bacterium]NNJ43686.1 transposase [Akkermansiaceae bacterium]
MKKKRHTPEQIVKKLHTASEELARGACIDEVCRKLAISVATYHRWNKEYGNATTGAVKRLKELEKENARLKKLVAEQALDMDILKEVNQGKW